VSTDRLRSEGRGTRERQDSGGEGLQKTNWQDRVVEVFIVFE